MRRSQYKLRYAQRPRSNPRERPLGYIDHAGWLARGVLCVEGWLTSAAHEPLPVSLKFQGTLREVKAERFCYSRSDLRAVPGAAGQIVVLRAEDLSGDPPSVDALSVRHADCWYHWSLPKGLAIQPDVVDPLARAFQALLPEIQRELAHFLGTDCVRAFAIDVDGDRVYRRHHALLRRMSPAAESLSPHPPYQLIADGPPPTYFCNPELPLGFCVDAFVVVDPRRAFIRGWLWDVEGRAERLSFVSPAGARCDLMPALRRFERQDIADIYRARYGKFAEGEHGFVGLVDLDEAIAADRRFGLELGLTGGRVVKLTTPAPVGDPFLARDVVMRSLPEEELLDHSLLERHVDPALERLQERCREEVAVHRTFEVGSPPHDPQRSVVIPLLGSELLEPQLAQFADAPDDLRESELIFVLDSPALERRLEKAARQLSRLYRVPFRVVLLAQLAGYAAAVNAGAAQARGRLLVLMHGDVFGDEPGWLSRMAEFYFARENVGAIGPKLLEEDASVQQAGFLFSPDLDPDGQWSVVRHLAGLPRHSARAAVTRKVPALSAACMMIERELFERLGGFRDRYVAGESEDVDLCLRLIEAGRENWCFSAVELFHLGGESRSPGVGWRRNAQARFYNRWLQNRLWGDRIKLLTEGRATPL
jgi:glycosyltransferase involved in cell wall biosynthesis